MGGAEHSQGELNSALPFGHAGLQQDKAVLLWRLVGSGSGGGRAALPALQARGPGLWWALELPGGIETRAGQSSGERLSSLQQPGVQQPLSMLGRPDGGKGLGLKGAALPPLRPQRRPANAPAPGGVSPPAGGESEGVARGGPRPTHTPPQEARLLIAPSRPLPTSKSSHPSRLGPCVSRGEAPEWSPGWACPLLFSPSRSPQALHPAADAQ